MKYDKSRFYTILFIGLLSLTFLSVGLYKVNQAVDPAFEDTGSYLEGALFIKENGGVLNFFNLCLSGQYKIVVQHPLYPLLLSTFASRDLSFFPEAKLMSLAIGLIVVISLFFITMGMFGQNAALLASVLLIFNTSFLVESSHVACESLLILFILLSWYFMVKGLDNNRHWIWAGTLSGLAYMTKGTGIFVIPIFVVSNLIIFKSKIVTNKHFWLFFLFFLVFSSPLILRNIIVYDTPFYEGINSNMPWLDSYEELSKPEYRMLVNWREHTYSASNLPTMFSYIESHSVSQIAKRAMEGIKGETRLLLNSMDILIVPLGKIYFSLLLFLFFFLGLMIDRDKRRRVYTVTTIFVFFLPFAWYYQVIPVNRFLTPLIPIICIYSSLGCIGIIKYIDKKVLAKYKRFSLLSATPFGLTIFLILVVGYFIATQKAYPSIHTVDLSNDQYELFSWLRNNVKEGDVVILGPANRYWGYLWYVGYKGKLAPKAASAPVVREGFLRFNNYLKQRNVNLIVLHKDNYLSFSLEDYFEYSEASGLVQKMPIEGWKLIYKYSENPTKFLIYRIEHGDKEGSL